MRTARAAGTGCLLRAIRAYFLFVLVCTLAAVAGGYLASWRRVRRAEQAWAAQVEPMESFAARYPPQADSPAARRLDEMTRPLGIRMILRQGERSTEWQGVNDELLKKLGSFLQLHERGGTDELAAVPPDGRVFLDRERARLDGVQEQILGSGPLLWEQNIAEGTGSPIPSLLGHRQTQILLLTRAWDAAGHGRPDEAARALEASWTLNASVAERPDLLSRLIAVAVSGMQHGVLRAARLPPAPWLPRMRQRSFASEVQVAYQLEAWNWTRFTVGLWGVFDISYMESGEKPPPSLLGNVGRFLTTPYVRLSFAGMSEGLLRASQELRSERRCDLDVDRYAKEFEDSFPRWNILARIATPSVIRGWTAMRSADLDRELTERVLLARSERGATGRWPSAPVPSTVCESVAWEQQPAGDGSVTIQPSQKPFAIEAPGWGWSVRLRP